MEELGDYMRRDSNKYKEYIKNYWRYYKELENELLSVRKYIEFHEDNFNTFSIELLKLYQAVCSEIDVIGNAIAHEIDDSFKPEDKKNNIYKWWYIVQNEPYLNRDKAINDVEVALMDEVDIKPWAGFRVERYRDRKGSVRYKTADNKGSPIWWDSYNSVKHSRTFTAESGDGKINYSKANLGNVCNAFAALYILEKLYMNAIGTEDDLEAFADYSVLFDKIENITSKDIDAIVNSIQEN